MANAAPTRSISVADCFINEIANKSFSETKLITNGASSAKLVAFERLANESYTGELDYIALISTNNFFVGVTSANTGVAQSVNGRVWGYRAKADASTYAALVQSEVLSA